MHKPDSQTALAVLTEKRARVDGAGMRTQRSTARASERVTHSESAKEREDEGRKEYEDRRQQHAVSRWGDAARGGE